MDLRQLAKLLRSRAWIVLLGALVTGVTAFFVSQLQTPIYATASTLLVDAAPDLNRTNNNSSIIASERLARTYTELLTTNPVLEQTIEELGLPIEARALRGRVNVAVVRDTQLITLTVQHPDPHLASLLANAIPEVFRRQNAELQSNRFETSKLNFGEQLRLLDSQIDITQAQIDELENTEVNQAALLRLQTELGQYRESYANTLQGLEQIRLTESQSTSNVVIVEKAQTPTRPVRPRTRQNTIVAVLLGTLLASGLVFLLEQLDDSIRSPEQLEQALNAPIIGHIAAFEADKNSAPLAHTQPRSPVVEAYRALRTNLQFTAVDKSLRTILVTSATQGEGKSTTATNLATVMAQANLKVVIVDADLRRPSMHNKFDQPNHTGLTNFIINREDSALYETDLRPTGIANLSLIPSGAIPPNPAELLGSKSMTDLLEKLEALCDVIIIDAPPTLAVTDAVLLSRSVDGVLFVVDSQNTDLRVAQEGLQQLRKIDAALVGVLMNRMNEQHGGYAYQYQYAKYAAEQNSGRFKALKRLSAPFRRSSSS